MRKERFVNIFALLILLLSFTKNRLAQSDVALQKEYADSLFYSENFYRAITEYKRLLFFNKDSDIDYYCFKQIGKAYKAGGFYDKAEEYFRKALTVSDGLREKKSMTVEIIRTLIVNRKTVNALNELDSFENNYGDSSIADYWRGWAYLLNNQPEPASYYFNQSKIGKEIADKIKKETSEKYSLFNVKLMSYIVPGSGQIYTGHYLSGAISFAWNFLFGYMTVKAFQDRRIVEGVLIGDLLWLRFYRGNIQNAERFANEKNIKLVNELIENLQNNYKGKKP